MSRGNDWALIQAQFANLERLPRGGFRNAIINGGFDVWQRGTSFPITPTRYSYTADRWEALSWTGSTTTVSRQPFTAGIASTIGTEAQYFLRYTTTDTVNGHIITQKIENVRTFAGKTISLSFWARISTGSAVVNSNFIQMFGSGGSSSVYTDVTFTSSSINTSWKKFTGTVTLPSVSGKTIGENSLVQLEIKLPSGNNTFELWGVQVEPGSIATPFEQRPIGTELSLCQRYYYKSPYVVSPYVLFNTGNVMSGTFTFPVTMRIAPVTITYFDALNTLNRISIANAGGTAQNNITPPSTLNIFPDGWNFGAGGIGGTTGNNGNIMLGSFEAIAEL